MALRTRFYLVTHQKVHLERGGKIDQVAGTGTFRKKMYKVQRAVAKPSWQTNLDLDSGRKTNL